MKKKIAIVINGAGGVGKDTLCELAAKHFRVMNISSVTPIKEIAAMCGWDGRKDDKSRKFLSDMKRLTVEYNNFPTAWATARYHEFMMGEEEILFVHIREGEEIKKFVEATGGHAKSLLIRGGARLVHSHGVYGNASDDDVENYPYDYYYNNEKDLLTAEQEFVSLLTGIQEEV